MNISHSSFENFLLSGVVWKVEANNPESDSGEGGEGGESGISNLLLFFLGDFDNFLQEHSVHIMNGQIKSQKIKRKLRNMHEL